MSKQREDIGLWTRREFNKFVASGIAVASAGCATFTFGQPSETSEHFIVHGLPKGYAHEAEKALEDVTASREHPFFGRINIIARGERPYTTKYMQGTKVEIDMPLDRVTSNTDSLVLELSRVVTSIDEPYNRGLAVVSQHLLQPGRKMYLKDVGIGYPITDPHLAMSNLGGPSDAREVSPEQYITDGSFVGYLIQQYGMERFMDLSNLAYPDEHRIYRAYPNLEKIIYYKTRDDLINEWREAVQKNPKRRPIDINFTRTPPKKSYDEELLRKHRGRVVVVGDENISQGGLKFIENDVIEAYDFVSRFFGRELPLLKKVVVNLTSNDPQYIKWENRWDANYEVQLPPDLFSSGNYSIVQLLAYPFVFTARNLASRSAAVYLDTLKPTLGGIKRRPHPYSGVDIDRLAKIYSDDLIPLDKIPYQGRDKFKADVLQWIQAGSFGKWVVNTYARRDTKTGVMMLAIVARGTPYESVFGASLATMERGWVRYLQNLRI